MGEIRNISDTATWAALFRAAESERPNGLFRDPFALRLAGERGARIGAAMRDQEKHAWAWVIRTYAFDALIRKCIERGTDTIVNLAAGLDARPYRMELPRDLHWIEVDLPDLIAYKTDVLRDDEPRCRLDRVSLDVANVEARRALFAGIARDAKDVLVISEGLLIYLSPDEVTLLGRDLAAHAPFRHWIADVVSPGLMKMMQREIGAKLEEANAPLRFAPVEGPDFFHASGWELEELISTGKAGAQTKRAPLLIRFFASLFPDNPRAGNRPWSGICLFRVVPSSGTSAR